MVVIVDGLCAVDIITQDGVSSDTVRLADLYKAALDISRKCVRKKHLGGLLGDLGESLVKS